MLAYLNNHQRDRAMKYPSLVLRSFLEDIPSIRTHRSVLYHCIDHSYRLCSSQLRLAHTCQQDSYCTCRWLVLVQTILLHKLCSHATQRARWQTRRHRSKNIQGCIPCTVYCHLHQHICHTSICCSHPAHHDRWLVLLSG